MFIRDVIEARALLAMQREAVRILHDIIGQLDVSPAPDGRVRCKFEVDDAFLDRLGVWGAAEAEMEDVDTDTDGTDDREEDVRGLDPVRDPVPVADIYRLVLGPLKSDASPEVRDLIERANAMVAAA